MSGVLATLSDFAASTANKAQGVVDGVFPPDQRSQAVSTLQAFAISHPKISVCRSTSQNIHQDRNNERFDELCIN